MSCLNSWSLRSYDYAPWSWLNDIANIRGVYNVTNINPLAILIMLFENFLLQLGFPLIILIYHPYTYVTAHERYYKCTFSRNIYIYIMDFNVIERDNLQKWPDFTAKVEDAMQTEKYFPVVRFITAEVFDSHCLIRPV